MAYIKVNHSQFETTATAIETYITKHKNNMNSIDNSITSLNASWQGIDYNQVKREWQQINAFDSTSGKMLTAMQNYANFCVLLVRNTKTHKPMQ